jgi:sugar phosphate isomerase/epimerase
MGLGNSNQLDVGHTSSGDLRRLRDLILHAVKVCFDIAHGFQSEHFGLANPA